eukprot:753217-Pyramimonas_sp.AAC.1
MCIRDRPSSPTRAIYATRGRPMAHSPSPRNQRCSRCCARMLLRSCSPTTSCTPAGSMRFKSATGCSARLWPPGGGEGGGR